MSASWRSKDREPSPNPTNLLFHCVDEHGVPQGFIPSFDKGQSWSTVHDELHEVKDFGRKEPHSHD